MMFVCVCVVFFHDTSANKKKFSDCLALFGLSVNQQNTKFVQSILDGKSRDLPNEQRPFNLLGMILEDQSASALRVAGFRLLRLILSQGAGTLVSHCLTA